MKHPRVLLAILAVGSTVQAFEFTAPVPYRLWEVQPGVTFTSARGTYDESGDFEELTSGTSVTATTGALRAKYGFLPGWNLEIAETYAWNNVDLGWLSYSTDGLGQPEIALKWMDESGIGLGVSVILPTGSSEIVGTDPYTGFEFGGLFSQEGERWFVDGGVGYLKSLEKDGYQPGGTLVATVKPRFKLDRRFALSVETQFAKRFKSEYHGTSTGTDGYLLALAPGVGFGLSNTESIDVSVPFSLLGKNARAIWGLDVQVHWRFGG